MATNNNHYYKVYETVLGHDISFGRFRPPIRAEQGEFYLKCRAFFLQKKLKEGKLGCKTYGDRCLNYLRCREIVLSRMYPERNRSSRVEDKGRVSATSSATDNRSLSRQHSASSLVSKAEAEDIFQKEENRYEEEMQKKRERIKRGTK